MARPLCGAVCGDTEKPMSWSDITERTGTMARAADDLLFELLPRAANAYMMELPISVIVVGLVLVSALVVYGTLLPIRKGDVSNVGVVLLFNAAVKATKGLCILGFYGSAIGLIIFGVMRAMP